MAGKSLTTQIIFNGVDNVSRVVSGIHNSVKGLSSSLKSISDGVRNAGFQASAISLPAALLLKDTVNQFADVEDANIRLKALMDDGKQTAAGLDAVSKELINKQLEVAAQTKFSQLETAEGMIEMSKAGMEGAQILASMKDVSNQAIVMQQDLATTAAMGNAMVTAMFGNQFENDADGYAKKIRELGDLTVWLANKTMASATEAQQFMKTLAPMAKSMGMSPEDMTALGVVLGKQGFVGANDAAKAARTLGMRMADPGSKALQSLNFNGVDTSKFFKGDATPITKENATNALSSLLNMDNVDTDKLVATMTDQSMDVMKRVQKALKVVDKKGKLRPQDRESVSDTLYNMISNSTGGQFDFVSMMDEMNRVNKITPLGLKQLSPIMGKERAQQFMAMLNGWDQYKDILGEVSDSQGIVAKQADTFSTSLKVLLDNLDGGFKALQYRIFDPVAADVKAIFKDIIAQMDSWGKAIGENPQLAKFIVMMTALVAVVGPVLIAIGLMAGGLSALVGAVGLLLAPLVMAVRGIALFAAALLGAAKTSRLALLALGRFTVIGAGIAAAGLIIYNAFGKIKEAFAAVDWSKVGVFASGAMKALLKGDWALAAYNIKAAWREVSPAVIASLNALKTEALAAYNSMISQLDGLFPSFAGFRQSIAEVGTALADFWNAFAPSGGDVGATIQTLKDLALAIGDAAFKGAGAILHEVADAINGLRGALLGIDTGSNYQAFFESIGNGIKAFADMFSLIDFGAKFDRLKAALSGLGEALSGLWTAISSIGGDGANQLWLDFATGLGDMVAKISGLALDAITTAINMLANTIKTFTEAGAALLNGDLGGAFDAIVRGWGRATAELIRFVQNVIETLTGLKFDLLTPITNGFNRAVDATMRFIDKIKGAVDAVKELMGLGEKTPILLKAEEMGKNRRELEQLMNWRDPFKNVPENEADRNVRIGEDYEGPRKAREEYMNPANDPANGWGSWLADIAKNVAYVATAETRDRLFTEVPVRPMTDSVQAIKDALPASISGEKPGESPMAIAELKSQTSAASRAAAASEEQNGKIDTSNGLLQQIASGISGLQNVMSTIPGALAKAASANIRANATNPGANKVSTNGLTSPTTLGHR